MAKKSQSPGAAEQLAIDIPEGARHLEVRYVPRHLITPDPAQPRVAADAELRASIAQNGILQPITVRPVPGVPHDPLAQYMIVDGERRWRGAEGILAELPVVIREDQADDARRLVTQLVANTGRPLSPIEEARAFRKILDAFGGSIEALAQKLGRPRTTVAERLQLLDLGPWLPFVEQGVIPVSYAVRALLPVRAVPDERHASVIEELAIEGATSTDDLGFATFDDFSDAIKSQYKRSMYPLAKSKSDYEPQPLFDTKRHDAECGCGTVAWVFSYSGKDRKACCNPDWWGPLDKAAKKALKAKEKADRPAAGKGAEKPKVFLPAGTPVMKAGYDLPKGVTKLAECDGRWFAGRGYYHADPFDPADLVIDDAKLVGLQGYTGLAVGTKDAAAVAKAREAWAMRWRVRRAELDGQFRAALEERILDDITVDGPGLNSLLAQLLAPAQGTPALDVLGIAQTLQLALPDALVRQRAQSQWAPLGPVAAWLADLPNTDAVRLASAIALIGMAEGPTLPATQVEAEQRARLEAIAKKQSPWAKMPKVRRAA